MLQTEDFNQALLTRLHAASNLHMVPAKLAGQTVIRFCVCAERATDRDMAVAWNYIRNTTQQLWGTLWIFFGGF